MTPPRRAGRAADESSLRAGRSDPSLDEPGGLASTETDVEVLLRVRVQASQLHEFQAQVERAARPSPSEEQREFRAQLRVGDAHPWGATVDLQAVRAPQTEGGPGPLRQAGQEVLGIPNLVLSIDGSSLTHSRPGYVVLGGAATASDPASLAQSNAAFLSRAAARGEQFLAEWTEDGTLVGSNAVEEAWKVTRQAVDAARERGEIFSVWVRSRHWYPAELLKFTRADLKRVVQALAQATPTSKTLFLLKQHGALKNRTPAQAVQAGDIDAVVRIAQEWTRA